MSAGAFELGTYEADSADFHVIRVQPETTEANFGSVNALGTGLPTSPFWAEVNRAKTAYGLRPRFITVRWTGTPPAGYAAGSTLRIPIFTPAVFNIISVTDEGTYLGAGAQVVSKTPESIYPGI